MSTTTLYVFFSNGVSGCCSLNRSGENSNLMQVYLFRISLDQLEWTKISKEKKWYIGWKRVSTIGVCHVMVHLYCNWYKRFFRSDFFLQVLPLFLAHFAWFSKSQCLSLSLLQCLWLNWVQTVHKFSVFLWYRNMSSITQQATRHQRRHHTMSRANWITSPKVKQYLLENNLQHISFLPKPKNIIWYLDMVTSFTHWFWPLKVIPFFIDISHVTMHAWLWQIQCLYRLYLSMSSYVDKWI